MHDITLNLMRGSLFFTAEKVSPTYKLSLCHTSAIHSLLKASINYICITRTQTISANKSPTPPTHPIDVFGKVILLGSLVFAYCLMQVLPFSIVINFLA